MWIKPHVTKYDSFGRAVRDMLNFFKVAEKMVGNVLTVYHCFQCKRVLRKCPGTLWCCASIASETTKCPSCFQCKRVLRKCPGTLWYCASIASESTKCPSCFLSNQGFHSWLGSHLLSCEAALILLKLGVGRNIAMHVSPRNFDLYNSNFYHCSPFSFIFFQTSS